MARTSATTALAVVFIGMLAFAGTAQAQGKVTQLFLWSLNGGVAAAPAARATRLALYAAYPTKAAITGYWIGAQDDKLLFSASKDATWADIGGYTEFASSAAYKEFKSWEAAQPSYKAIPVKTRTRLVAST